MALANIGSIYHDLDDHSQALKQYERSIEICKEINDKREHAVALLGIGNIYKDQGNYIDAVKYYRHSLKISEEIEVNANLHSIECEYL